MAQMTKKMIDHARYSTECVVHIAHIITKTHIVNTFRFNPEMKYNFRNYIVLQQLPVHGRNTAPVLHAQTSLQAITAPTD